MYEVCCKVCEDCGWYEVEIGGIRTIVTCPCDFVEDDKPEGWVSEPPAQETKA